MSLPVILRSEAHDDMIEIREWYEKRSVGLGSKFATRVTASLDLIGEFPEIFGTVWKNIRETKVKKHPHVIYYLVLPEYIDVLAVLDGRRNPKEIRDRLNT